MNLIEAIKSEKPFKRKGWLEWCIVMRNPAGYDIHWQTGASACMRVNRLDVTDITADDWEVQEPTVAITRAMFQEAYNWAREEFRRQTLTGGCLVMYPSGAHWDIVPLMAKRLGLE